MSAATALPCTLHCARIVLSVLTRHPAEPTRISIRRPHTVYPGYGDREGTFVVRTYGPWWHGVPSTPRGIGSPADAAKRAHGGGSIWPGVQNLLLAARALGLGATPTTLALGDHQAISEVLSLPDTMAAYCLIPVGYPLGRFGPVSRKPVEEIMRWNQWS